VLHPPSFNKMPGCGIRRSTWRTPGWGVPRFQSQPPSGAPLTANKLYWYDQSGNAIYETDPSGNELFRYFRFQGLLVTREESNDWVDHYGLDALGNVRWVYGTNSGSPYTVNWDISDYYPFGGERVVEANSTNRYKFTGKERDSESGNDYFGARHYASSMGRWLSPDRLNVTDDRLEVPSNTLNKYVYGANNPFRFVDSDGRDIVALYDPPHGVRAGHFMLFANNPQTGESAMMSFGPRDQSAAGTAITVVGGTQESTKMYDWPQSADDLRQNFAALSIQTTPEQAQEVINFIKNLDPSNTDYKLFSQNCTTVCRDALKIIKLLPTQNNNITPAGLWDTLYIRYGRQNWFQQMFNPGVGPRRTGNDYGNPRFGMNTFDFLWLQLKPPRACVEAHDDKGNSTDQTCTE